VCGPWGVEWGWVSGEVFLFTAGCSWCWQQVDPVGAEGGGGLLGVLLKTIHLWCWQQV